MELSAVRKGLARLKASAWLIVSEEGSDPNSEFLLGRKVSGKHAVIIPRSGKPLAIIGRMEADAVPAGFRKIVFERGRDFPAALKRSVPGKKIAVNYVRRSFKRGGRASDFLTHSDYLALRNLFPGRKLVPADSINALRCVRSGEELRSHRKAIEITARALKAAETAGFVGKTELEIAAGIKKSFLSAGADEAFSTIVASGPNSANPHHSPGSRRVRAAEPLLIDFGARWRASCADVTRTFWTGRKPSKAFTLVYAAVLAAQQAAISAIRPGIKGKAVNSIADRLLLRDFPKRALLHSLGHSLGNLVHEAGPGLSAREKRPLLAGQLVTVEPGLYFPGRFGVRIEDDLLVLAGKPENLSREIPREIPKEKRFSR